MYIEYSSEESGHTWFLILFKVPWVLMIEMCSHDQFREVIGQCLFLFKFSTSEKKAPNSLIFTNIVSASFDLHYKTLKTCTTYSSPKVKWFLNILYSWVEFLSLNMERPWSDQPNRIFSIGWCYQFWPDAPTMQGMCSGRMPVDGCHIIFLPSKTAPEVIDCLCPTRRSPQPLSQKKHIM